MLQVGVAAHFATTNWGKLVETKDQARYALCGGENCCVSFGAFLVSLDLDCHSNDDLKGARKGMEWEAFGMKFGQECT